MAKWVKTELRGKVVYAEINDNGLIAEDETGRVAIVYNQNPDAKVYRAHAKNLKSPAPLETQDVSEFELAAKPDDRSSPSPQKTIAPTNEVTIYTDGACTGNPGPMGIGVVIIDNKKRYEISRFLGTGTNNIAELSAIKTAIEKMIEFKTEKPIKIYTDSSYSIGVLSKNWKAKANVELINSIKKQMTACNDISFIKVKGHAGIPENERCDELATNAIKNS